MVSEIYQLTLDDGRKVPVNLYVIRKDLEQQIVLYWYQSHGRVVASEYWGKFYMVYDAIALEPHRCRPGAHHGTSAKWRYRCRARTSHCVRQTGCS